MHVLIGIVGAIAAIAFIAYRLTYVAREGQEAISDARGLVRRQRWKAKYRHNPLDDIDDPREVAVLLMTEIAKYKGALTAAQQQKISNLAQQHFHANHDEIEDMMASIAFATKDLTDVDNVLHKVLRPIHNMLNDQEKQDLISMMHAVAAVDGTPITEQLHLIGRTQDKLLN